MRVSYICIGLATALLGAATAAGQNVGPRIAYASNADGDYEIYTIQSDGTDPIQLTSNGDTDTAPAWSPDRTRIAFHSDRFGDGNIWIMDAEDADGDGNGDNLVQLTTDTAPDEEPRISPDGARIMFQSRRDTPGSYELYAMDIDGSNVVRLTTSAVADTSGGWSPDSSRIVWSAGNNIWVMDAIDGDGDGNGDNAELWLGGHVGAPRWSFDGSTLVYSNYDGDWDIYLMGPGGANVRPLTAGPADEWGDFSPNGRHVVYADNQGGSGAHNLYVIPTDGSAAATQITSDGTASPSVAWAPYVPRVAVGDATGPPGGSVVVPVTVTELRGWDVVGMALELVFDPAILTPSATDAVLLGDAFVDAAEWYVEYGETTPGILTIALAGVAASGPVDAGVLATVQFDVSASAGVGTQTPLALAVADLNEGSVPRALVDGSYSFFVMYGDVTGNGAVRPYDAGWILEFVASRLIDETIPLPIEYETPAWSTDHVPQDVAWEVADVYKGDDPATVPPDTITAMDAVTILQHVVGAVPDLPFSPPASAPAMLATTHRLVGSSASARPGTEIVVSLSAEGLHAGELRLDFDPRVLRLKGVSAGSAASTGSPLLRHVERDGAVGVAVATSRPLTGSILDVAFETAPGMREPASGVIRASRVRLNGANVDTTFEYAYRVEPYRTRLMANYPNPFNPETWIPFELAETSDVTIRIYDLAGSRVRTLNLGSTPPGAYSSPGRAAHWDGTNDEGESVASGMYLYELGVAGERSVRRMVVLK